LPCEEFLYDFKRRLRAARKRAVLAADHRAHGSPATHRPPQHGPAVPSTRLPASGMVGRKWGSGPSSRFARTSASSLRFADDLVDRPAFSAPRECGDGPASVQVVRPAIAFAGDVQQS
jgi:hypothetical protein